MVDNKELAKRAVQLVLGEENEYVQHILLNTLESHTKEKLSKMELKKLRDYNSIPLEEVQQRAIEIITGAPHTKDRNLMLAHIEPSPDHVREPSPDHAKEVIIDVKPEINVTEILKATEILNASDIPNKKLVTDWIIKSMVQDNLQAHDETNNMKYWKLFNGSLAIILPFISGITVAVIEYFIMKNGYDRQSN